MHGTLTHPRTCLMQSATTLNTATTEGISGIPPSTPRFSLHPSLLIPHPSSLTPLPHPSSLTPHPSPLIPHPSPLTLHPSPLIPHPSPLTLHPSPLIPHPSSLTPHPSPISHLTFPLTPHSYPTILPLLVVINESMLQVYCVVHMQ